MKTSSLQQLDLLDEARFAAKSVSSEPAQVPPPVDPAGMSSAPLVVPDFGEYRNAYAANARIAGRMNAARISDEEHNRLLKERAALLDKKFADTLTRKEAIRLEYVRWSLDRIEDARHGATLDVLESSIVAYEDFLSDLQHFRLELALQVKKSKRR